MTKKQKAFVEEYLIDLNATQAAIRAGYSPDAARQQGAENMAKPDIKAAIDKKMAERSRRTGVNQDRVIRELAKAAFANAADLIDTTTGKVKPGATRDDLSCIQSVKVEERIMPNGMVHKSEVKLTDKLKALELLGKHLGMFTEQLKVSGAGTLVVVDDIPDAPDDMGDDDDG